MGDLLKPLTTYKDVTTKHWTYGENHKSFFMQKVRRKYEPT